MEAFCKWYKSIQGCHRDIIFYYWFHLYEQNFMGCSKMLISAIGYYGWPFWSFNGPHIHSMGPREGACSYSLLACVCCAVEFYWWCESGNGELCERVCSELLCCGSDTSRHREHSVPDIWRREAGKRWHWGVMKKCLCVRGLKNNPFRVACLLAEQRQGPVSEICCKDYLACILYQGTANRILFLRPALAVPHLLRKDTSFLCIPPLGPRPSLASFSLHSSFHLSLFENTSSAPWAKSAEYLCL